MSEVPVNTSTPKIIYALLLANIIIPFLGFIGLIMAYINQNNAPQWLQSHYQLQIRTFWISVLYLMVGALLSTIMVGYIVILFTVVWIIIRCVRGLHLLSLQQPYPNPTSWLFS